MNKNLLKDDLVSEISITVLSMRHAIGDELNTFGYNGFNLGPEKGEIFIQALDDQEYKEEVVFNALAFELPSDKNDPFFEICLANDNGDQHLEVFKSEYIKNTAHPDWGQFRIPISRFGREKLEGRFFFKIWDHDKRGSDDYWVVLDRWFSTLKIGKSSKTSILRF